MKKLSLLGLFSLFILTGCTTKVTCTASTKNGEDAVGAKNMDTTIDIVFDKEKVKSVDEKVILTFGKDNTSIDTVFEAINKGYEQYKDEKGIDIKTSKENDKILVDVKIIPDKQKDSTDNVINVELSKEELIKDLEKDGYTCK